MSIQLPFKSIHILGVSGTLMAPFAVFLKKQGIKVTGTDEGIYPPMSEVLARGGVKTFQGYTAKNLDELGYEPDFVIVGNVIRSSNPEMVAVKEKNWKALSLPEFMETHLLPHKKNIVITGTHGKTTTSSLMTHVLRTLNLDPSYFIGGVSHDLPESFYVSTPLDSSYFVLEGDEYDTVFWDKVPKFFHYLPDYAFITSIEFDHADIYKDLEDVKKAFRGLLKKMRPGGHILACSDYPAVCDVLSSYQGDYYTYSFRQKISPSQLKPQSHFSLDQVRYLEDGTQMDVLENGKKIDSIQTQMSGEHNALNALSVFCESKILGLNLDLVKKALSSYRGVKRRQDIVAEVNGVIVMDDFAHHPTAVALTLKGLKEKYKKRLLAVFEPRSATSRRSIFQQEYTSAFSQADILFISEPYDQSLIEEKDRFSSKKLVEDLNAQGKKALLFKSVDEGLTQVMAEIKKDDLLVVLSNGGFGGFIPKCVELLNSKTKS